MIRCLFCLLMAMTLFACASVGSLEPVVANSINDGNTRRVLAVDRWHLVGRLSVRHGNQSWLSRVEWRHIKRLDVLTLSTSLGGVMAKLSFSTDGVYLTNTDGYTRMITQVELESLLGYSPPLQQLKYWVRGVADPAFGFIPHDFAVADGRGFEQTRWQISLERYYRLDGLVLPKKIVAEKGDLKIKLMVDEWLS